MKRPSLHPQEKDRLNIIRSLNILDTHPEERFDRITKLAKNKLGVPICTISIIDEHREWYKSYVGLSITEGPRKTSFCAHTLLIPKKDILIVEDTLKDSRFFNNPQVTANPSIRFYAGINLMHKESGLPVGVFCIKDYKPRIFSKNEIETFLELAKEAEYQINKENVLHSKDNV